MEELEFSLHSYRIAKKKSAQQTHTYIFLFKGTERRKKLVSFYKKFPLDIEYDSLRHRKKKKMKLENRNILLQYYG